MHESGENYLETILLLQNKNGGVRSIDIALALDYSKASISRAMGILKENGYINIDRGGLIEFTEKGRKKAESIYERHRLIARFLMQTLNIEREAADQDACRIEHVISQDTFERIKEFAEKL